MARLKGEDFIFTGLQPWDLPIGSNARDIALEVSKNNRVLYVNTPLDFQTARHSARSNISTLTADIRNRIQVISGEIAPLRQESENLWVLDCPFTILPANKLPDGKLFDMVNRINNHKIFRYVKKMLEQLQFKNVIHFCDNDIYRSFYAKEYLGADLEVYYRRDNLLAIDFWKRHACRLEPMLIAKSDLVVCNSYHLSEIARRSNPNTIDIGQGVDLSAYEADSYSTPTDIANIPRPIVGYMGHITSLRLDADLIYELTNRNRECSFVLAGSTDEVFDKHQLHSLKNVYFLGSKPQNQVANYINSFDICINPQSINELTIGNYPRKIDEYLALGKPTIATHTKTMEHLFKNYVYLCHTPEEYNQAITKILDGETSETKRQRVELAHTHTWNASVEALYAAIEQTKK